MSKHEFFGFMDSVKQEIAAEYRRITARSVEDPGTAGDRAEENWAAIFRDWLPSNYPVVTKGRIVNANGETSPQVDILVLSPCYPRKLLNQKLYFAGGVVAAFECKLNLRASDFKKVFSNAARVKRLLPSTSGTPFDELHQKPVFGLLAHSAHFSLRKNGTEKLFEKIFEYETAFAEHPREMLDIICVADTATWILNKAVHIPSFMEPSAEEMLNDFGVKEGVSTIYLMQSEEEKLGELGLDTSGDIFSALMYSITRFLAFEDLGIRGFSEYLTLSGSWGGIGQPTIWDLSVLSSAVVKRLKKKGYQNDPWSKWKEYWDML